MTRPTASARKNGAFGYKALVIYAATPTYWRERTHIPVRKNFKTRDEAIAYAERHIATNYDKEPRR